VTKAGRRHAALTVDLEAEHQAAVMLKDTGSEVTSLVAPLPTHLRQLERLTSPLAYGAPSGWATR
jgi:hypothetical protein